MAKQKAPVIVAELGRPETAAETAARKAENSRLYKERKTWNNLVLSLIVSLGLVLLMVLIVPRGTDQWSNFEVDAAAAASENAATAGMPLVAPETPDTWKAKHAQLRSQKDSDIMSWHIGYTTENGAYAEVVQAFTKNGAPVNETWIGQQFEGRDATGTEQLAGLDWVVYDYPNADADKTNSKFGMQTKLGNVSLLAFGTDRPEVIRTLAAQLADQATALGIGATEGAA